MACEGIDFCSKKNCLEQERCVFNVNRNIEAVEPRKGPKKKNRNSSEREHKIELCQMHVKFCSNQRACEILGQCILKHPLVSESNTALKQLRKPSEIKTVVKVIEKLMPSLKRIGQRKYYKPEKRNN